MHKYKLKMGSVSVKSSGCLGCVEVTPFQSELIQYYVFSYGWTWSMQEIEILLTDYKYLYLYIFGNKKEFRADHEAKYAKLISITEFMRLIREYKP